jgi:RHS repeat-associated protein
VQTASATTEFIYDYAGRRVSSWLSPNNFGDEGRIYWDGQQIAYRATDGTTYFDHQDTLGTERMRTNYGGSVGSSYVSLPWGDGYTATVNNSGADQDNAHFADLERDAESGTEHAQFRNYTSRQGRWLAPDQYAGSYDATNPQSMNRYAYVLNNPMSMLDPSGLVDCTPDDPCLPPPPCDPSNSACNPVNTTCLNQGGTEGCIPACYATELGCDPPSPPGSQNPGELPTGAPSKVGCGTVLPNGQTVGSVVQQQRAILQNAFNASAAQAQTGTPSNPLGYQLGAFTAIVGPNGPIDFKKGQTGQTFVQMGLAGNFAYYAIGAGFFSPTTLDLGAGAYALTAAAFFPHSTVHFSDLTGNFFSDSAAAQMRGPGLAANGCSVP